MFSVRNRCFPGLFLVLITDKNKLKIEPIRPIFVFNWPDNSGYKWTYEVCSSSFHD